MFVRYGTFQFQPYEAGLSIRSSTILSPRGFPMEREIQVDIVGEVVSESPTAITTRLNQISSAFASNYQDIGLYHDDGSPTAHVVLNADSASLTGNYVKHAEFPLTTDGEYATGRQFHIVVAARHKLNGISNILLYEEAIKWVGNAGPLYKWRKDRFWGYYAEQVSPNSMQEITQKGRKIASNTWQLPPSPWYPQPYEKNDERVVEFKGPAHYPNGYQGFITEWEYFYTLPTYDDTLRPHLGY